MYADKTKLLALYFLLQLPLSVFAQGGGPPPPGLPNPPLPIDTYSTILLFAGLLLGLIVIISRRKLKT